MLWVARLLESREVRGVLNAIARKRVSLVLIYLSLLVALAGVLMYGFASNAKVQEIGRLSFAVGLLAFLLKVAEPMVGIP